MSVLDNGKWVKTRKKRQCFGCLRKYPPGATLMRCVFTDMGQAYSVYTCAVCEAVYADWHRDDQADGYNEGGIREACEETWEDKRKELEEAPHE